LCGDGRWGWEGGVGGGRGWGGVMWLGMCGDKSGDACRLSISDDASSKSKNACILWVYVCVDINMWMWVYTYMSICVYEYVYVYVRICDHLCLNMWLSISDDAPSKPKNVCILQVYGCVHVHLCIWVYTYMCICVYEYVHMYVCICDYGVATMSRMLKNICLFAEYRSLL